LEKFHKFFGEEKMKKLHLGCGKVKLPNFVHVDLADYPHINYRLDIGDLHVFEDDSIDYIYCSHSLEYKDRVEAAQTLREWHRVLKKGGIVRVAVPDFEAIVALYCEHALKGEALPLENRGILGPLYGRMMISTPSGKKFIYHKTAYDFDSLKRLLELAGFHKVRRYDWRETIHKDFDDYSQSYIPHLCKDKGRLMSLNVEAIK
jgi:predicted SAM-dependent methyltransferase